MGSKGSKLNAAKEYVPQPVGKPAAVQPGVSGPGVDFVELLPPELLASIFCYFDVVCAYCCSPRCVVTRDV